MAGDWIKMEIGLPDKPEVWRMAGMLGIDADSVVGKLLRVWGWFDTHTTDGNAVGVTYPLLDRIAGVSGFAEAMALCGWLVQDGHVLSVPKFGRHNGKTAKNRALTAERVAKHRAESNDESNAGSVTKTVTREEKRREEEKNPPTPRKRGQSETPEVPCPYDEIVRLYHDALPSLPHVRLMPAARQKALRKVWAWVLTSSRPDNTRRATNADEALQWFADYFARAAENDFLMGRVPRSAEHAGWQCDLDYLLTDKGMKQVIEKTKDVA